MTKAKKILLIIGSVLIIGLFVFIGFVVHGILYMRDRLYFHEIGTPIDGALYVNGELVDDEHVTIRQSKNYDFAYIPFVKTLVAYGFEIEWKSDTIAELSYGEKVFTLDIENITLSLPTDDPRFTWGNLLRGPSDPAPYYNEVLDHEIIMEDQRVYGVIRLYVDQDCVLKIDRENARIDIYSGS